MPTNWGYVTVENGQMYYEERGDGTPLVFLHAGIADSRMWDAQAEALSFHYRVIRCDLRGYGKSKLSELPFAYHEDIAALFRDLGLTAAWVVGASFGGSVALDFTLTYPDFVAGLILVDAAVSGSKPTEQTMKAWEEEETFLEARDIDGASWSVVRWWVDGPHRSEDAVRPEVRQLVYEMQRDAFQQGLVLQPDTRPLDPPALERLGEIRVPTLTIVGDKDLDQFIQLSERFAADIPNARRVVITDTAHLPSLEKPDEFNQLVIDFVERGGKETA